MNAFARLPAVLAAVALAALLSTAHADSTEAMCEVRKDGSTWKGATGPCTFSQRQGYIDIGLRNGDRYSLSPASKSGHYRDQKGNKVTRTAQGGTEEFRWEGGKKLTVTFGGSPPPAGGGHGGGSSVSSAATSACMSAVNRQYSGNVRDIRVVRSDWSQANSEVILDAVGVLGGSATETWRCLVANDGTVQDLSAYRR